MWIVDIFRAHIVDIGKKTLTVECTGNEGKIKALIESLRPFGIKELVRTGRIAVLRGMQPEAYNGKGKDE